MGINDAENVFLTALADLIDRFSGELITSIPISLKINLEGKKVEAKMCVFSFGGNLVIVGISKTLYQTAFHFAVKKNQFCNEDLAAIKTMSAESIVVDLYGIVTSVISSDLNIIATFESGGSFRIRGSHFTKKQLRPKNALITFAEELRNFVDKQMVVYST